MNQHGLVALDRAGEHGVQIMQRMVLVRAVRIVSMMVALRRLVAAVESFGDDAVDPRHVRRMAADERNHPEDLGNEIEPDNPRAQSTFPGHRRHVGAQRMTTRGTLPSSGPSANTWEPALAQ